MSQEKVVEEIVRQVLQSMYQGGATPAPQAAPKSASTAGGLCPEKDYPLSAKHPDMLKTPTGKKLTDITLESVLNGSVTPEDVRIAPETLRMQAEIADGVGRNQFGDNLRRAAELTAIPDKRILEIYNALRPYRSTKAELFAIADEMETKYNAVMSAALVREAADVYERRNRLRAE
ncbi:MAG: diol dehydratase small subunit [Sporomusaceae bacterium]|nr:diol dehydratase small subunit [Sporomusaceae bacterium]